MTNAIPMGDFFASITVFSNYGYIIGIFLMLIPFVPLIRSTRKLLREEKGHKAPFTQKLIRPAGESLRLQIIELRDKMLDSFLILTGSIVLPGVFLLLLSVNSEWISSVVVFVALSAICYPLAILQWRKIRKLRTALLNHLLGFDGERYVGSELDQLMLKGYRVFHDFVFTGKPGGDATTFNIDHIAVGPGGVFAVETKCRRKPIASNEKSQVTVTGDMLEFSSGVRDSKAIPQIRSAAKDLRDWLTPRGDFEIQVQPVLVVAGWWIVEKNGNVPTFSGKNLAKCILGYRTGVQLTSEQIDLIGNQIENHCRDIESE